MIALKKFLLFFLLFSFSFASASEILCDDSLATGSLWQLSINFSGSFDKAIISIDSSDVLKAYYNSSDRLIFIDSASVDKSKVNSYFAGSDSLKLVLYPLDEGNHSIKLSLYKDSAITEEKTRQVEFVSSSSLISEIKKINKLYSELSSLTSELSRLSSEQGTSEGSIDSVRQRLEDINSQISIVAGALRENSRELSSAKQAISGINSLKEKVSDISERVDSLSPAKANANDKGFFPTAFSVLGNAAFPLGIVIVLLIIFLIAYFVRGKLRGNSAYSGLDYPGPK